MPRSPAEGAATRGVADLEIPARKSLSRDRRVRSGTDRRLENTGPPDGVERRRHDRRSHDRRSIRRDDRRARDRRSQAPRRGTLGSGQRHLPRVASREHGPLDPSKVRTPRLLRAIIITIVAVACLLAATLTGPVEKAGAAAAAKPKPGAVRAVSGGVAATLTFVTKRAAFGNGKVYSRLRLTVKANGRTTLSRASFKGAAGSSYGAKPVVRLAEVTGDGVLDPVVQIYTGGAHCCSISSTAPSAKRGWGKPITRDWGNFGFELADLGGSPQLEWKAFDERFVGIATFAASRSPIQIWRLADGAYVDVTREFPDYITADAAEQSKDWNDAATMEPDFRAESGRTAAAAWMADLAMLGKIDEAKAVLAASQARGDFEGEAGAAFLSSLGYDLQTWGYVADATTLGLTYAVPAEA